MLKSSRLNVPKIVAALVFLLSGGTEILPAQAGASACDENLKRLATAVNGYQVRGDRCEGLYARQVSGTALFLASFTQRFDEFDARDADSLNVSWPVLGNAPLQIRAETIRGNRFYRMDTQRNPGDTLYRWSKRVISAERINRNELAVRSWTKMPVGTEARSVYLPLRLTKGKEGSACGNFEVVLATGQRLREVRITLVKLNQDGAPATTIKADEPLRRGFYPAGVPIVVVIQRSQLPDSGIYRFTAAADLQPSGIVTRSELLYIPASTGCPG